MHDTFIALHVFSIEGVKPQTAGENIMWLVLLFRKIQVETVGMPLLASAPATRATDRDL